MRGAAAAVCSAVIASHTAQNAAARFWVYRQRGLGSAENCCGSYPRSAPDRCKLGLERYRHTSRQKWWSVYVAARCCSALQSSIYFSPFPLALLLQLERVGYTTGRSTTTVLIFRCVHLQLTMCFSCHRAK